MSFSDQFNDPAYGILVRQLAHLPELQEFVKTADLNAEEASSLPDAAFAWPEERRFPIHTDKHAALAWLYADVQSRVPSYVKSRIKEALDVYNLPETLFHATNKVASNAEPQYLLPKDRLFPVTSKQQLKEIQPILLEKLAQLDIERRAEASVNFVKLATENQVAVNPRLHQMAGNTVSNTRSIRDWLMARADATKDAQCKEAYQTLSDGLAKASIETRDRTGLVKLAQTIAKLDERSGLIKYYDRKLPDALSTVFNTEKIASNCVDLCGSMVPVSKLAALPTSFWEDLGGVDLVNEIAPGGSLNVAKLAEVVETLPLDLKVVLKSQLRA